MTVPFVLNVGGVWIPLTGVARETPRPRERGESVWLSGSGRRRIQFAARSSRTWTLAYTFKDPSAVAWLAEAAAGNAGPVWLLDRAAAQVNMLDPKTTQGRFNGQPMIPTALGIPVQALDSVDDYAFIRKVRGGQTYHLSGWTSHAGPAYLGAMRIECPGLPDTHAEVLVDEATAPGPWSSSIEAPADGDLSFVVSIPGVTTRLRLTEGSVDTMDWYPGQNTPCRVAVSDPDDVLSLYREDRPPMSSYAVTLREVG